MNWLLLIAGIILLLLMIKGLALLEKKKAKSMSISNQIKQNSLMVPLGIVLLFLLAFLPYQVWVLFGRPQGWEILYIFGFSELITIVLCFWFYSREMRQMKLNEYN
ncbi:hypothetical protein DS745_03065 [Anaerobacillus alkaliphilus]|uniref:Uncharacterized protein n=1 Tax=Anaerobacillus alkaliphilus TaxID=1548597 RepID=A0A4Q0VY22_9BACI|nr:hypothetical protein [Anaerobacillus alkaliphilus]RXJ04380.1 hypothetical protein DS745_03065 [Anaerobacillus alkaliphilus]